MTIKPDDGLRALLRKHVPPPVHWTSIETGLVQRGVPDLNGCADGRDFWVECKAVKRGWAVKVRPEQVAWLAARWRHGGRALLAVRRRTSMDDQLWLLAGWAAPHVAAGGLPYWLAPGGPAKAPSGPLWPARDALLGCWGGNPARWPWQAVRAALLGR